MTGRVKEALPPNLHAEMRLTARQVQALCGFGQTKLNRQVRAGTFPQPERSGQRFRRWRAGDVLDFLNAGRVASSGGEK